MPAVSFIPYFPDESIDTTLGDFHIRNWWRNRERLAPAANVREFLDRYFGLFRRPHGDRETRIAIVHRRDQDPFAEQQDFSAISRFANALMAAYLFNLPTGEQQYPHFVRLITLLGFISLSTRMRISPLLRYEREHSCLTCAAVLQRRGAHNGGSIITGESVGLPGFPGIASLFTLWGTSRMSPHSSKNAMENFGFQTGFWHVNYR